MKKLLSIMAIVSMTLWASVSHAGPVVQQFDSANPPSVIGGYAMTDFGDDPQADGFVTAAKSSNPAINGQIDFRYQNQTQADMLLMEMPWWEHDHGRVYSTSTNWIELILPENTRAISFYVGASFNGWGWLKAFDNNGNTAFDTFDISPQNSPGFGIHTADACGSISRVIIDPYLWGVGNFAINQGSCADVPEPGTASLLLLGLLGAGMRKVSQRLRG